MVLRVAVQLVSAVYTTVSLHKRIGAVRAEENVKYNNILSKERKSQYGYQKKKIFTHNSPLEGASGLQWDFCLLTKCDCINSIQNIA